MNIVKNRKLYFLTSGIVIIPGLISLFLFGLKLSIDFTGGSRLEFKVDSSKSSVGEKQIKQTFDSEKVFIHKLEKTSDGTFKVRTDTIDQKKKSAIISDLGRYGKITEKSFDTVGPTIGKETEVNALKAVVIASLAIMAYIAFAFRKVSKPVASWKFGVCAILALLHDVLVVVGIFSLFGHFLKVEVDSLFITALLTVMGFSVHDTIVVFDRIRENLSKLSGRSF